MKRLFPLHLQCLPLAAAPPLPPPASTRIRPRSDPPNCARTDPSRSRPQTPPPEKTEREEERRWRTSQPRYEKKKENRPTAKARGKLPRACTHSRRRESTPRSHFLSPQSRRRPFFSLFSPLGALMSSSQKRKDHGNYKTLKVSLVSPPSHAQRLFPSHPRLPTV